MIKELDSFNKFRNLKSAAWVINGKEWIKHRYLPNLLSNYIVDTIISYLNNNEFKRHIDIGCGNGWLFNDLKNKLKTENSYEFIGLDSNNLFVNYLNNNLKHRNVQFYCFDIENTNLKNLESSKPTIVTAVLSLIETPDLGKVFKSISNILKLNDLIICVVLDPYLELIRLNKNYKDLRKDLSLFRKRELCYYSKNLSLKNGDFESKYFGILHRIENYISKAQQNSLYLKEIKEIDPIDELGEESTIYKILIFEKK